MADLLFSSSLHTATSTSETSSGSRERADEESAAPGEEREEALASSREQAFPKLVQRCWKRAFWIARDLVGEAAEAEDLCQDALLRAYENWDSFREEASRDTWFFRILTNLCLNHRRRRGIWSRVREWVRRDKEQEAETFPLPTPQHPERQLQARELGDSIQAAMAHLSPQQRTVFVLRYLQDFSIREIAAIVEVSEGTVKTHLFRALQTLRQHLESQR